MANPNPNPNPNDKVNQSTNIINVDGYNIDLTNIEQKIISDSDKSILSRVGESIGGNSFYDERDYEKFSEKLKLDVVNKEYDGFWETTGKVASSILCHTAAALEDLLGVITDPADWRFGVTGGADDIDPLYYVNSAFKWLDNNTWLGDGEDVYGNWWTRRAQYVRDWSSIMNKMNTGSETTNTVLDVGSMLVGSVAGNILGGGALIKGAALIGGSGSAFVGGLNGVSATRAAAASAEGMSSVAKTLHTVGNAFIMTQATGGSIAQGVYDKVYKDKLYDLSPGLQDAELAEMDRVRNQALKDGKSIEEAELEAYKASKEFIKKFGEENPDLDSNAKKSAGKGAEATIKMMAPAFLLNLTMSSAFVKTFMGEAAKVGTRNIISKSPISIKRAVVEGGQEYLEEGVVENVAEKYGLAVGMGKNYTLSDLANTIFSWESVASGFIGFGVGGTMDIGRSALFGRKKHREEYEKQQQFIKKQNEIGAAVGMPDVLETITAPIINSQKLASVVKEYNSLIEQGKDEEAKALSSQILAYQAFDAFESGTTKNLINNWNQIANNASMKPEVRNAAKTAVQKITEMEAEYNQVSKYRNRIAVFENAINEKELKNVKKELENKIASKKQEVQYQVAIEKGLGKLDLSYDEVVQGQKQTESDEKGLTKEVTTSTSTQKKDLELDLTPNGYVSTNPNVDASKQIERISKTVKPYQEYLELNKQLQEINEKLSQTLNDKSELTSKDTQHNLKFQNRVLYEYEARKAEFEEVKGTDEYIRKVDELLAPYKKKLSPKFYNSLRDNFDSTNELHKFQKSLTNDESLSKVLGKDNPNATDASMKKPEKNAFSSSTKTEKIESIARKKVNRQPLTQEEKDFENQYPTQVENKRKQLAKNEHQTSEEKDLSNQVDEQMSEEEVEGTITQEKKNIVNNVNNIINETPEVKITPSVETKSPTPQESNVEAIAELKQIIQSSTPTLQTIDNVTFGTANKQGSDEDNEDALYVDVENGVFVLADGMGGETSSISNARETSAMTINMLLGNEFDNVYERVAKLAEKYEFNQFDEFLKEYLNGETIPDWNRDSILDTFNKIKLGEDLLKIERQRTAATALIARKTAPNTYKIEKVGDTVFFVVDKDGNIIQSHGLSNVATTTGYVFSIKDGKPIISKPSVDEFTITLNEGERLVFSTDFIETEKAMSEFIATDFGKNIDFGKFQKFNKRDDSTFITIEYKAETEKGKPTVEQKQVTPTVSTIDNIVTKYNLNLNEEQKLKLEEQLEGEQKTTKIRLITKVNEATAKNIINDYNTGKQPSTQPGLQTTVQELNEQAKKEGSNADLVNFVNNVKTTGNNIRGEGINMNQVLINLNKYTNKNEEAYDIDENGNYSVIYNNLNDEGKRIYDHFKTLKQKEFPGIRVKLIPKTGELQFTVDKDSTIPNENQIDESKESFEPKEFDLSKSQEEGIKEDIGDWLIQLEEELGYEPSFEQFIRDYIVNSSKKETDRLFNVLVAGWELNGMKSEDYQQVYNKLFKDKRELAKSISQRLENANEILSNDEINKQIEKEEVKAFTREKVVGVATDNSVVTGLDFKQGPALRFAYSSTRRVPKFKETITDDKRILEIVDYENQVELVSDNVDALLKPSKLLRHDNFGVGEELSIEFVPPSHLQTEIIRLKNKDGMYQLDEKDNPITVNYKKWLESKLKENPNFKNTQEYYDNVPLLIKDKDGDYVAYVHDIGHYKSNSKDYSESDLEAIIYNTRLLRKQVIDSLGKGITSKIKITNKSGGTIEPFKLKDKSIPLREAVRNPIILRLSSDGTIYVNNKKVTREEFNKKFPNNNLSNTTIEDGRKGITYDIRKKNNNEYIILPTKYNKLNNELVESVINVVTAMYQSDRSPLKVAALNSLESLGFEKDWKAFQNYIDLFVALGKMPIQNQEQLNAFKKANPKAKYYLVFSGGNLSFGNVNESFDASNNVLSSKDFRNENIPTEKLNALTAILKDTPLNVKNKDFDKYLTKPVGLFQEDGTIIKADGYYYDYLNNLLTTNIKSQNIGTEENPHEIVRVQPIINYELVGLPMRNNDSLSNPKQETKEENKQKVAIVNQTMSDENLSEEVKKAEANGWTFVGETQEEKVKDARKMMREGSTESTKFVKQMEENNKKQLETLSEQKESQPTLETEESIKEIEEFFPIFATSSSVDEVINKLIESKLITKNCK